jgi:hypothetical protein
MKYKSPLSLKKLFRKYGDSIQILRRTETIDNDGRVVYTYPNTISTYGLLYSASGLRETWYEIGFKEDIDYVICLDATISIDVGDLILLSNNYKLEVREIIPRTVGYKTDYLEILGRKVE